VQITKCRMSKTSVLIRRDRSAKPSSFESVEVTAAAQPRASYIHNAMREKNDKRYRRTPTSGYAYQLPSKQILTKYVTNNKTRIYYHQICACSFITGNS